MRLRRDALKPGDIRGSIVIDTNDAQFPSLVVQSSTVASGVEPDRDSFALERFHQRAGAFDDAVALEQILSHGLRHAQALRDDVDELGIVQ